MEIQGDFTPGASFVRALGLDDTTLDVEITSNRGDLLSHLGVARELAAEGDGRTVLPEIPGCAGSRRWRGTRERPRWPRATSPSASTTRICAPASWGWSSAG